MYNWVGASFNATPKQLGAITLGRAMMQALSSPLGGVAGAAASPRVRARMPASPAVPVPPHTRPLLLRLQATSCRAAR